MVTTTFVSLIISFIVLLGFSAYYSGRREKFSANILLVIISYFQGMILALVFFSSTIFDLFLYSIVLAIGYYLIFSRISMIFDFIKYKLTTEPQNIRFTPNIDLIKNIATLWGIPESNIHISTYTGEKSDTAFRKMSLKFIDIYIGENFLKSLTNDELIFTLSHEVAHTKVLRYNAYPFIFLMIYAIIGWIICLMLIISGYFMIVEFFIVTLILYIIGIMATNWLLWKIEYKADELGVIKSKNLNGAISLFEKFSAGPSDYGRILNLIFYTHPLPRDRIENLKNLKIDQIT